MTVTRYVWSVQASFGTQFTRRISRLLVAFGPYHTDGLVQERRNSSALAMELRPPCINPSIYTYGTQACFHHYDQGRSVSIQFLEGGQQYRLRQLSIANLTSHTHTHTYIYIYISGVCLSETKSRTLCREVELSTPEVL